MVRIDRNDLAPGLKGKLRLNMELFFINNKHTSVAATTIAVSSMDGTKINSGSRSFVRCGCIDLAGLILLEFGTDPILLSEQQG
jgi:hypothetical protein